jgi:cobalamin-dependent methionine synthase I
VKIAPHYSQPVVHVLDASRAVGVAGSLANPKSRPAFAEKNRQEQEKSRRQHAGQRAKLLSLEKARRRRPRHDFKPEEIAAPDFTGARPLAVPLAELVPFIDWSPFFHTWELRGRYPRFSSTKSTARRPPNFSGTASNCCIGLSTRNYWKRAASMAFSPPGRLATTWRFSPMIRAARP